jgi:hypothetical protein
VVINFNSVSGKVQLFVPGLEEELKHLGTDLMAAADKMMYSTVEKYFGMYGYHKGVVRSVQYDPQGKPWFRVVYMDGDTEDMRMPELYDILTCIGNENTDGKTTIVLKRMKRDVIQFLTDHTERDFSNTDEIHYATILKHFESTYMQLVGAKGNWFKKELLKLLPNRKVIRHGKTITLFYGITLM